MNDSFIIHELLLKGANVNAICNDGKSVLHYAVLESELLIVLKLIPKVTNVNHKDKRGNTALHFAVLCCSLEIVKALVNDGANCDIRNNSGYTAAAQMPESLKQTSEIYNFLEMKNKR